MDFPLQDNDYGTVDSSDNGDSGISSFFKDLAVNTAAGAASIGLLALSKSAGVTTGPNVSSYSPNALLLPPGTQPAVRVSPKYTYGVSGSLPTSTLIIGGAVALGLTLLIALALRK